MSATSPLNGSCLFTQRYCLTDTHSTWRLGNWSHTVWGRDEICAPVKVLLKHKPDTSLLFKHRTVTYFDSLTLRLVRLSGQCPFWAKARAHSGTYRLSRLAVPVKSGNSVICEAPFKVLEGRVHEYYWEKILESGNLYCHFQSTSTYNIHLVVTATLQGEGDLSVREKLTVFLVQVNVEKRIVQQAGWGCHRNVWKNPNTNILV